MRNDENSQRPMDIDDLKEKICTAFQNVTSQMLHLRCYITHGMQYLHDMNCVVYAMVVMLRSNLIWRKITCFKNAYTLYWTINTYSSLFMMYSFCVFPNGSLCICFFILSFVSHFMVQCSLTHFLLKVWRDINTQIYCLLK